MLPMVGIHPKAMTGGGMEAGARSRGKVAGRVHGMPTCEALTDRPVAEPGAIVAERHAGMRQGATT